MISAVLIFMTGTVVVGLAVLNRILKDLPSVDTLEHYVPPLVTNIYDTYGRPIGEFFTERRTSVPLTQIPVDLQHAVMAIEDAEFYDHWGINPRAILRAFMANLKAGRVVQGGSTLTQQLAKTIFLTRKKTYTRKFKELLLTLQIEKRYSKDEILQLYLNQIYFGGGAYGVQAASRLYFDKEVNELNLSECALLAGLVRSPNRYSPLRNPTLAEGRRSIVLDRMRLMKFIEKAEEDEANAISLEDLTGNIRAREAPYFVEEVKKLLEPKFGLEQLEQGGISITTTLDIDMQKAAEEVLEKHLAYFDLEYSTTALAQYNEDLLEQWEKEKEEWTDEEKVLRATETITISTIPPQHSGSAGGFGCQHRRHSGNGGGPGLL
jgi:penicillin-binding protein 1A